MELWKESRNSWIFWLSLSILAAILFSLSGLVPALRSHYTVQDDARQHIFWLQEFNNPQLFPNDLIADYFQSVAPLGFTSLYKLVAYFGIDVFWFNKISPLLIGIVTTVFCFGVCGEIFPIPVAGFLSSLLLNQNLWLVDDLSSGTPRAFVYLLLLSFIYFLLRQQIFFCLLAIVFQGLFYPQAVLISATVLGLRLVRKGNFNLIEILGLGTASIILAIYAGQVSDFAPVITASQAKLSPEFLALGRSEFFTDSFVQFWLLGRRSGFFPIEWQYSLMCVYGISLWWLIKYPRFFTLGTKIKTNHLILLELLIAACSLFFIAHLVLFRLHLPARYTHHTIRLILALTCGITLAIVSNSFIIWLVNKLKFFSRERLAKYYNIVSLKHKQDRKLIKLIFLIPLSLALLYPTYAVQNYPERLGYVTGKATELYHFLQQQPTNSLIATLSSEADFIPSLAQRSVLVAEEYSIPYHSGYYQQLRQRVKDLITAQYSPDKKVVKQFIEQYQPDLWLLDNNAFTTAYLDNNQWLKQFTPEIDKSIKILHDKQQSVIQQQSDRCIEFQTEKHTAINTNCLLKYLLIVNR